MVGGIKIGSADFIKDGTMALPLLRHDFNPLSAPTLQTPNTQQSNIVNRTKLQKKEEIQENAKIALLQVKFWVDSYKEHCCHHTC